MVIGWILGLLFGVLSGWNFSPGMLLFLTLIFLFIAGMFVGTLKRKTEGEDLSPFFVGAAAIEYFPFALVFFISSWSMLALKLLMN